MRSNILLCAFAILFACQTEPKVTEELTTNIGRWQLTETCLSPGNACVLKKINNGPILEFLADGTYQISNNSEQLLPFSNCNGTWLILPNNTDERHTLLKFTDSCTGATINCKLFYNTNTIDLNPFCKEECRYTYKSL
jgi:hypothetical protein